MYDAFDKYSITQYPVKQILSFIDAGDIAIPEIQDPLYGEQAK